MAHQAVPASRLPPPEVWSLDCRDTRHPMGAVRSNCVLILLSRNKKTEPPQVIPFF